MHLDALHPVADVALGGDGAWVGGSRDTGPAAAALELLPGAKELGAAARAKVAAGLVVIPERASERALGGLLAKHAILLGRQLAAPLLVALLDLVVHRPNIPFSPCAGANGYTAVPRGVGAGGRASKPVL